MIQQYNMKKKIKILIIIPLLIYFTNTTYSQKSSEKTIIYGDGYYVINIANGFVAKKKFVENQNLTFLTERNRYDERILRDTIVSGKYFTKDGNAFIDGIFKKWGLEFKELLRVKGVFKVSNNENGIGITTNKKEGKELVIHLLSNNQYNINIIRNSFSLESNISNLEEPELSRDITSWGSNDVFDRYILNDKKVKFSFNNGDIFKGSIKTENLGYSNGFYYHMAPYIGEYKYASGEVCKGIINYYSYYGRFYVEKGTTIFADGTIGKDNWLNHDNLTYDEIDSIYRNNKSPTEMRDLYVSIIEEKERKLQEKKVAREKVEKEKFLKKLIHQKKLIEKYGEHYGNLLTQGKLLPGMSEDMVKEVWEKEWFNINSLVRDGRMIEIWEFDESKMQRDIINKGKESGQEEGAIGLLLMLNLSEELGLEGINAPKTLVFIDEKLTDIYR